MTQKPVVQLACLRQKLLSNFVAKGFPDEQVKRAVQEQNGQLIVVQMGDENPKYPVVTDGVIQVDVLESIGRNEEWLLDNLSKQGHDNVANIFIAEYDKGAVTVVTYE